MAEPVKGKSEAGRRREERAHQTRARIVDAALRLFLQRGYAATTVEAIAREAKVASATVYQAFGTKQAILARSLDVAVAGDAEPVALLERDWVQAAREEPDPVPRLALVVTRAADVAARTAAIKEVMRDAAATEPAVRELIRRDHERRYRTQQALVELVLDSAPPQPGMEYADAVATFFALINSHTYQLLVGHLGWTIERWQTWLVDVLHRELLGANEGTTQTRRTARGSRRRSKPRP